MAALRSHYVDFLLLFCLDELRGPGKDIWEKMDACSTRRLTLGTPLEAWSWESLKIAEQMTVSTPQSCLYVYHEFPGLDTGHHGAKRSLNGLYNTERSTERI